ncbi:MAG: MBL fold metallo-hydrolase [Rhodoferax sp.]
MHTTISPPPDRPVQGRPRIALGRARRTLLAAALALGAAACTQSSLPVATTAALGQPSTLARMEALMDQPGPVQLQTHTAAHWAVNLGGLLNLRHEAAQAAALQDRSEPIALYAHVLRHPQQGVYWVDSGLSLDVLRHPQAHGLNWLLLRLMPLDQLQSVPGQDSASLARSAAPRAVFLTHLHLDHILGMPDLDQGVPVYVGPMESRHRGVKNAFVQGPTDALLGPQRALREWPAGSGTAPLPGSAASPGNSPQAGPNAGSGTGAGIAAVWDVFGDASVFALHTPGHTPGSMSYLARTPQGPVLMVGDTSHTAWGWEHGVEPGSFTADASANRAALLALKALVQRHPGTQVRLGHQALGETAPR